MHYPALLAALLTVTAALAQTQPCEALNDQNPSVSNALTSFGFAGPNSFAWQLTPTASNLVFGGRVFTANTTLSGDRFMSLEVWSDVAALPGARLAGGTWKISASLGTDWQGADFDNPVLLTPGVPVWLVWIDPGFSTPPVEPGGSSVPAATRNGAWQTAPASAPKVRLYCSLLDAAGVAVFGQPCTSSRGTIGTLSTNQVPVIGNASFAFDASGFGNNEFVLLVLGLDPNFVSLPVAGLPPGCMQHVDFLATLVGFTGASSVRGPIAAGHAYFPFAITPNPAFTGVLFSAQALVSDATSTAALPFVASNALRMTLR